MDTSTASEQSNKTYEDAAVNLCTSFATTVDTARVARRGSPAIDLRSIFWILLEARCIRAHGVDHLLLYFVYGVDHLPTIHKRPTLFYPNNESR